MGAILILTPVVVAAWPAFSAAIVSAATTLGYSLLDQARRGAAEAGAAAKSQVDLTLPHSEIVTGTLARAQRLAVARDGVTVTFSRDERGQAAIQVAGSGHSEDELRALGEELGGRVVQQYVYQRVMEEVQARHFDVVEEQTDVHHAIRLKVRHWQS